MSQPTITTKLVRNGQPAPITAVVQLADDGTAVELTLPPGTELSAANLMVQVPDDSAPIDLRGASSIVCSAGAWVTAATDLTWLSLDWGARRALVTLTVTMTAGTATHLRIRLADAGPWVLATPAAIVALVANTVTVQLPGLAASRMLIEPVTRPAVVNSPEDYTPATSKISAVFLTGSRRPPTLTVSVAPAAVVQHEASLLPPLAILNVREPLLNALRKQLPGRDGGTAQIVLRSSAASELRKLALSLGVRRSLTRWKEGGPELTLPVKPNIDATVTAALDAHPQRLTLQIVSELRPELSPSLPLVPGQIGFSHRCGVDSVLAQSFHFGVGGTLVGVDLWLAARTPGVRGELKLCADERGNPSATPLLTLPVALDDPQAGIRGNFAWLAFDLPEPLVLAPDAPLWIVLELAAGEVMWALAQNTDGQAGPTGALLRHERAESWVPRNMSFGSGPMLPWAVTRPRLRNDGPPPSLLLNLKRGNVVLPVSVDADGWLRLGADALAALNGVPVDTPLVLAVRSPVAGQVVLRELMIEMAPQTSTWNFTNPP